MFIYCIWFVKWLWLQYCIIFNNPEILETLFNPENALEIYPYSHLSSFFLDLSLSEWMDKWKSMSSSWIDEMKLSSMSQTLTALYYVPQIWLHTTNKRRSYKLLCIVKGSQLPKGALPGILQDGETITSTSWFIWRDRNGYSVQGRTICFLRIYETVHHSN